MRPKNIKNFHFLVKSHPAGAIPLTDFENFRDFYTANYPTLVIQISCDSHHRLRSYCWETARPSIKPNFSMHPVGKTMCWIKKWMSPSDDLEELYHLAKFGEDHTMRSGCRCENVVFFVCHTPSPEHRAFEGCIVRTSIALPFIARFRRGFQLFFTMDCSFSSITYFAYLLLYGATIFAK